MSELGSKLPKGAIKINRGPHDAVIILDGTYAATVPKKVADAIEALQQHPTYRVTEDHIANLMIDLYGSEHDEELIADACASLSEQGVEIVK